MVLPLRNHQATATVAIIVGTMIASMIAVELMRICFSAAATGPTGIPRGRETGPPAMAHGTLRRSRHGGDMNPPARGAKDIFFEAAEIGPPACEPRRPPDA